jgi:hypothetical protein
MALDPVKDLVLLGLRKSRGDRESGVRRRHHERKPVLPDTGLEEQTSATVSGQSLKDTTVLVTGLMG